MHSRFCRDSYYRSNFLFFGSLLFHFLEYPFYLLSFGRYPHYMCYFDYVFICRWFFTRFLERPTESDYVFRIIKRGVTTP
jgi:hypothetical protein